MSGARPPRTAGINERKRWLWADGEYHDSPPPAGDDLVIPAEMPIPIVDAGATLVRVLDPPRDVDDGFVFTDRSRLRVQALEFAMRAAEVSRQKLGGADILREAEYIEAWIAHGPVKPKEST